MTSHPEYFLGLRASTFPLNAVHYWAILQQRERIRNTIYCNKTVVEILYS